MERLAGIGYPPSVGKLKDAQIAQASTWTTVPDVQAGVAAMHTITMVPKNGSTTTFVNPLDPGNPATSDVYDHNVDSWGTVVPVESGR